MMLTVAAASLLMIFMVFEVVQIVSSASFACVDRPELSRSGNRFLVGLMIFECIGHFGLFLLAAARFAELMLA